MTTGAAHPDASGLLAQSPEISRECLQARLLCACIDGTEEEAYLQSLREVGVRAFIDVRMSALKIGLMLRQWLLPALPPAGTSDPVMGVRIE